VRTRLSIQSASFAELGAKPTKLPGMWQTMGAMYRTEGGIKALYRGIIPTVTGVAPYVRGYISEGGFGAAGECLANQVAQVGLNFMTYEFVRQYLTLEGDQNPSAVRKLAAGAISGAVAQTCTYPL